VVSLGWVHDSARSGIERVGRGLDARARLDLEEAAVGEGQRDHREERDRQVRIEPGDGIELVSET
jgi:hypothetical protein